MGKEQYPDGDPQEAVPVDAVTFTPIEAEVDATSIEQLTDQDRPPEGEQ